MRAKSPSSLTILPLKSAGMARNIDGNIRGISIPPEMILTIQKSPGKVKTRVTIAAYIIGRIREMGMAGVLVSTAGWGNKIPWTLDEVKLLGGHPINLKFG